MKTICLIIMVCACIAATGTFMACSDSPSDHHHTVQIDATLTMQPVTFKSVNNQSINAILALPQPATATMPAVVVLHGSGGMWKNDDPAQGMSTQFLQWAELLTEQHVVALFIDSYASRGLEEFGNVHPPHNAVAAAEYVRTHDAYAGLNYLRSLHALDNTKLADDHRIGLLGFSHGGTAAIATLADVASINKDTWSQQYNGNSYPCPPPAQQPQAGGFLFGVAYYPGAFMYGYFGNPTNSTGVYVNYAPLTILAAALDPLYTSGHTEALVNRAQLNGAEAPNNPIELIVYADANHSFDGKTEDADGAASVQARATVLNLINNYFTSN